MRPLRLRLQAFGSFPGAEEIDFETLGHRGLFVVSGDTGTGKTTILDAMCWALYGEMPLKDARGVRSDHAPSDTETYVELTFECDGARYVVTRRPAHERPAKRGGGTTTEPASASLVRLGTGGADGSESLSTKATDTTSRCTALVGLSAEQFQRVVLLPQGEFAKFLLAETKEREPLLGQLFGGQVFEDMVEYLKARRNDLASKVTDVERDIEERLDRARDHLARTHVALCIDVPASLGYAQAGSRGDGEPAAATPESELRRSPEDDGGSVPGTLPDPVELADRAQVGSIREAVVDPLGELRARVAKLKRRADATAQAHGDAEAAAKRFDATLEQFAVLARLDEEADRVAAGEAAANASKDARPVVTEADALVTAQKKATAAAAALEGRVGEIASALASIGVELDRSSASTITATVGHCEQTQKQQIDLLRAHGAALGACKEARDAHAAAEKQLLEKSAERTAASDRVTQIEETELPLLREGAADPESIRTQIADANKRIERHSELGETLKRLAAAREAKESASAKHSRVFEAFVATQAPRMATELVEGEPCPVCGSHEHPKPAQADDGPPTSSADLEDAAATHERATTEVNNLNGAVERLRSELADVADAPAEKLETDLVKLESALEEAMKLARRIKELDEELTSTREKVQHLDTQIAALSVTRETTEAHLENAEIALAEAEEAVTGIDRADVERAAAVLATASDRVIGLDELFVAAARSSSSVSDCEVRLGRALEESSFSTVEDARAALRSPEEEARLLGAAENHRTRRHGADSALRTLADQGVPDERPDLEITSEAKTKASGAYDAAHEAFTTAGIAVEYCDIALAEHDRFVSDSDAVRTEADRAERAYTVCNKGGALSMSLKRWVLTRELDHVTAAANVHLANMTSHRYSLRRRAEVTDARKNFGLDLEVLDATTGRPRSTTSLSGGEQFQASLALALGLADVVSRGGSASGRRFEALFVDEGFGSLDRQSLEDAIEALHQLRETGRMVAAITHVEAMKQQLHVGIEVTRLPVGGGSTLVVNP